MTCLMCPQPVRRTLMQGRPAKFCSAKCKTRHRQEKDRARKAAAIEASFQRAKAWIRYQRALQQSI